MHPPPPSIALEGGKAGQRLSGLPLVSRLLVFGCALLLPALLLSGVLLWSFADSERKRLEDTVRETALHLAGALDRKLEGQFLVLRALSLSPALRGGDLPEFHAQATELGRAEGFAVMLRDETGRPLIDTRRAWGAPLPQRAGLSRADRRALNTGRPAVSDLSGGPDAGWREYSVILPVRGAEGAQQLLSLVLPPEAALQVLRPQDLPEGWTSSYVGTDDRIIARSDRNAEFLGSLASEDLRRSATGEAGIWAGTTADGQPVVAAYQRSQLSGWRAAVGAPRAVVGEPLHRSLSVLGALAAAALTVSALLALWAGRGLSSGAARLADAARRLERSEAFSPSRSGIREIDMVGEAIGAASRSLRERALERDQAEEALREETRSLETLNRIGTLLAAELDLRRLMQAVTDAATELSGARLGAFFYNEADPQGGHCTLYTLSGIGPEAFAGLPLPRPVALLGGTFRGEGILRIGDVTADARYGRNAPNHGMPEGHPPIRSYLAVPVVSRSGGVIGGLFFGHPEPGVFTERAERLVAAVASQAAIAVDNARLFRETSQAAEALERRVAERTRELEETNARLRQEVVAREEAQARLSQAQKMEALGQLAGGIAHDFNNVLQAVTGALYLISQRAGHPERVRRLAGMAMEAVERGASVTRRLLTFARRGELRVEAVEADRLLVDLAEVFRHTLGAGIRVRIDATPGLPPVLVDRGQLEAVLVNLATNARDAMPAGGQLVLSAAEEMVADGSPGLGELAPGPYLRLSVADSGAGMDPAVLARAAEPFFTTKPRGKGTGLGLAMAKGFAEQSGGGLTIESQPGQGTRVTLWLPRGAGAVALPATTARASRPAAPPALVQAGREVPLLLVVDDEPVVRGTVADGFVARGWRVVEASSGPAALERIGAEPLPELLVTDLSMPGMDGLSLLAEARRRRPGLPALLLTGYMGDEFAAALQEAEQGGPFALLRKPASAEELAARAEALLALGRA